MRKIYIRSLGCPKNMVDSEHLLGLLTEHRMAAAEDPEEADLLCVNTCGFIQAAVEESIEVILELASLKRPDQVLAVIGCLPQRYQSDLAKSLPEVDFLWGAGGYDRLAEILSSDKPEMVACDAWPEPGTASSLPGPRMRSAPFYRAYLKIADGCSNACTYCLIPGLRGPLKSRSLESLVQESAALAESGVKELILVAQDTTAYGRDLGKTQLAELLRRLCRIEGLSWIRLLYAYPTGLTDDVVEVLASENKICKYLDIPLQHVSSSVLRRMGRPSAFNIFGLIQKLRHAIPDIALRTTMMVGFPGETEEDFQKLMEFVEQSRFNHLGVFKFSPEEGAPASKFSNPVPQKTKEIRRRKIMALQRRISRQINRSMVGLSLPVLVEGVSEETDLLLVGRTQGQAPDIDGRVYITRGQAVPGDIRPVRITEGHDYDLIGEIESDATVEA